MDLHTDTREMLVILDGTRLHGHVTGASCGRCRGAVILSLDFEATFCPACNTWLELRCQEPGCIHCLSRPARPLVRGA